jgi:hypothetical protein
MSNFPVGAVEMCTVSVEKPTRRVMSAAGKASGAGRIKRPALSVDVATMVPAQPTVA